MKKILLIVIFSFTSMFSQMGSTAIIKGIVKDVYTNKPIESDIEFRDQKGAKIKVNSNSISGIFEQVLKPAETYKVIFSGKDILREEMSYTMPDSGKFFETNVEWTVKKISLGTEIYNHKLFKPNTTEFTNDAKSILDNFREVVKFNRAVYFELTVCSKDSFTDLKNPPQSKFQELNDQRIQVLNKFFDEWKRERTRISIANTNLSNCTNPKSDIKIKVSKIDDLFK